MKNNDPGCHMLIDKEFNTWKYMKYWTHYIRCIPGRLLRKPSQGAPTNFPKGIFGMWPLQIPTVSLIGPKDSFYPESLELLVGHQDVRQWQIWVHQKHVRWKLNPHLKTCRPFSINFTQKCFDYLKNTCRSFGDWWLRKPLSWPLGHDAALLEIVVPWVPKT